MSETDMQAAARRFFKTRNFAVVGASQDTSKFGYRILAWYNAHNLPVTPINPRSTSITVRSGRSRTYQTVSAVSALPLPAETALSFLTPPAATLKVLEEAKAQGVKAVWLQPGSFDQKVWDFAATNFESAVGGFADGTVGGEGWCVLVDGERVMREVGRDWRNEGYEKL